MALTRDSLAKALGPATNPNVTHKISVYHRTLNGNPNGDPDTGGIRLDSDGHAIVTGVATKRKVRDYVEGHLGRLLYVSRNIQEDAPKDAKGRVSVVLLKDWARKHNATSAGAAIQIFWDIRMFGAVFGVAPEGKGKVKDESDDKVDKTKDQILGPVQVGIVRSVDPAEESSVAITRMASEDSKSDRTMGRSVFTPKAEFIQPVTYTGHLGLRHNVSQDDLIDLYEGLLNGFDYRPSTMRGDAACTKLVIRTYPNATGALGDGEEPVVTVVENRF